MTYAIVAWRQPFPVTIGLNTNLLLIMPKPLLWHIHFLYLFLFMGWKSSKTPAFFRKLETIPEMSELHSFYCNTVVLILKTGASCTNFLYGRKFCKIQWIVIRFYIQSHSTFKLFSFHWAHNRNKIRVITWKTTSFLPKTSL